MGRIGGLLFVLIRSSAVACIAAIAIGMSGCGGGPAVVFPEPRKVVDDEEEPTVAQPAKAAAQKTGQPAAQAKAARPRQPTKQPAHQQPKRKTRAEAVADAADEANTGGPEPEASARAPRPAGEDEEPPERPEDIAAWSHDDFRNAKAAGDPRLVQAVLLLGRKTDEAEENVKLLVELLQNEQPAGAATIAPPAVRGLPQAIIAALAANRTSAARDALKAILLGKLTSPLEDRALTTAALGALVETGGAESDALLFTVLSMPDAIRPPRPTSLQDPDRSRMSGEELRRECLTLVRQSASPQLRVQLAEYLAHPSTPPTDRALLLPVLKEPRSDNFRAQATLALAGRFDPTSRDALQASLLTCARRSIDTLFYAPDTQLIRAGEDQALRSVFAGMAPALLEENSRAIEVLWSQAFLDKLGQRLRDAGGALDEPGLFALATSLPCDSLRPIVRAHLYKHRNDGDALTRAAHFTASAMRDPGMLLVLKSLPRDEGQTRALPRKGPAANPQLQRAAAERKAKQAWSSAVQTMVGTLNRRFEIAGEVARLAARRTTPAASTGALESVEDLNRLLDERKAKQQDAQPPDDDATPSLPLAMPGEAKLLASHHIRWPEDLEGRTTAPTSPLVVHYAKARVPEQPQRLVTFFTRQLKGAQERPLENGLWLDSAQRPAPGKLRSIDVMITRGMALTPVTPVSNVKNGEELTVEILWIEINDFLEKPE
jgi:hypothetical protein